MDHQIHIALPDERYQAIATLAAQQGLTPEMLAEIWLAERQEAELVRQIKQTLPNPLYQRYKLLLAHRDTGTLTTAEHAELLQLTDQVELFDAKRVELLMSLAHMRQKSLEAVMADLGIDQHLHE